VRVLDAIAMVMGFSIPMVVFVVVVGVAVRVPVEDPVQVAMRMGVRIVGRLGFGPFAHAARFGKNMGKAR
jgi:hypothetical protein